VRKLDLFYCTYITRPRHKYHVSTENCEKYRSTLPIMWYLKKLVNEWNTQADVASSELLHVCTHVTIRMWGTHTTTHKNHHNNSPVNKQIHKEDLLHIKLTTQQVMNEWSYTSTPSLN
jgi:hypothetical protein